MKKLSLLSLLISTLITRISAQSPDIAHQEAAALFADNLFHLSEVMLHDVANPPAASRFYAYSTLAAYYASIAKKPEAGPLREFHTEPAVQIPEATGGYLPLFASIYAMLEAGRQLMPSGYLLEKEQQQLATLFKKEYKLSAQTLDVNIALATDIARQVIAYAKTDGYSRLSTYKRYTPSRKEGKWYPTPPEYMPAVEPQWKTIRPFFLDSADQFAPIEPTPFSLDTASSFYKQTMEVYNVTANLTEEQKLIASFWDCNPFAVSYSGHMAIGLKKISPGGHWMGITGIACKKAGIPLEKTILTHTLVALTLHDAFISCWNEKYKSDRIRPETAINKYLDPKWRPLLQTPPFPEYTSGHSVASASASVVLTYLLGDNFSFTDTSEVYFGLPERDFTSFYQAANEAAISRLYGGIHFRDACEAGVKQGRLIGNHVVRKVFKAGLVLNEE